MLLRPGQLVLAHLPRLQHRPRRLEEGQWVGATIGRWGRWWEWWLAQGNSSDVAEE